MDDKTQSYVELLKYPVLVFSIVLSIILLKFLLGLEFGMVTEVSTSGLKFSEKSNQATMEALTELEVKLNESMQRIQTLENKIEQNDGVPKSSFPSNFSVSQYVSDATANIANLRPVSQKNQAANLSGYVWIGNYKNEWEKPTLAYIDSGQPISIAPNEIVFGTEYKVLGNLVVRDGLPANDSEYFKARKSLGVVARGNRVRIIGQPAAFDREFAVQYWVKIEYQL